MIIKTLQRSHINNFLKHSITPKLHLQQSTNKNQLSIQIRTDLIQKLQKMNIKTNKSIFFQQIIKQQHKQHTKNKKQNKHKFKILNEQQKKQLGLMIPKSTFNLRMTRQLEKSYRQAICEDLYQQQKSNLSCTVRILQLQNKSINVDQYINSIYKDIFSRYMLSRGLGVQWQANHSSYGVMNPKIQPKQSQTEQITKFYEWLIELLHQYPIKQKQIIGVYSYSQKRYIQVDNFEVQTIHKIGYYFTMNLTKFGKFTNNFNILIQRGEKIDLLIMVEDITKLLNIQAICIQPKTKMIILSKYIDKENNNNVTQQQKIKQYLITSIQVYYDHKDYFIKNGYTKHTVFHSHHLLQMQVQDGIKILQQIPGYSRKGGAYLVDRFSGIHDFQFSQTYNLKIKHQYLDQHGKIISKLGNNPNQLYITDPQCSQKLLSNIQQYGIMNINQMNIYATHQDQSFSYNTQKLHFRITNQYIIPIPQSHINQLQKSIQNSILSQSKIQIPKLKNYYPKPRDKRKHKKLIKQLLTQQTQYMNLKTCLHDINYLTFTTMYQENINFTYPVFVKNNVNNTKSIIINHTIQNLLISSLQIIQSQHSNYPTIKWKHQQLSDYVKQMNTLHNGTIQLQYVMMTSNLFNAYKSFKNYPQKPQLSNVIIEPQSKTQDVVPYFFHLHFMIYKMYLKNIRSQQKGRKIKSNPTKLHKQFTNKLFSLIKFHPTIIESQRYRNIEQVLFGTFKINNQQQYGYGLQALRLWVARNDNDLGDRQLCDYDVNKQLQVSAFIRKLYWQILPLMNIDTTKTLIKSPQATTQFHHPPPPQLSRDKLTYLHRFIIDHINYYIYNMDEHYKKLQLNQALQLTQDFFKNYIYQIFIKTIKNKIISFPFHQHTPMHLYVLNQILKLIAVIAPLLPYSAYHISKTPLMQWPNVKESDIRSMLIPDYNRMTKLRVQVRNRLLINNFSHSQLVIPINIDKINTANPNEPQYLPQIWKLTKQDLQLFFNIENISLIQPSQLGRNFKIKINNSHPIGHVNSLHFYQYKDVCVRCSPNKNYGTHLCHKCLTYLNEHFGKKLPAI